MKILHILSQHPESTGSGYYLQNMLRQAARHGHRNLLIAGISQGWMPKIDGVDTRDCRFVRFAQPPLDFPIPGMSDVMPYPSSRFAKLTAEQLSAYRQAFREVIDEALGAFAPDIIHSHHLWLVSAITRQLAPEIPMMTSCHSTDLRQYQLCPHLQEEVHTPCRQIDRVLALSHDQAQMIETLYAIDPGRIEVVGGGFAAELFSCPVKEPPPPVRLLYAGKLSFAKGVDSLLQAFARIADPHVELHLAGSGSGSEAAHCLRLAERVGPSVVLHGRVDQSRLAQLMGQAHIFILPSLYEGLPLVLLEALASGCRIITTALPGCLELLDQVDRTQVSFIPLPMTHTIDRLTPVEQESFACDLARSTSAMADLVRDTPNPANPAERTTITRHYTWEAVYTRIYKGTELA